MAETMASLVPQNKLDDVMAKYDGKPGDLLGTLEEAQELNKFKYLPEETLSYIAQKKNVPLSRIYSVVTFYSFFNLKPQGEHTIIVCRGTACHTKGSKNLLEDLQNILGGAEEFGQGEPTYTTPDNKFTIRTVACFGQCALAPVVMADGVIYSHMTSGKLRKIVDKIRKGGRK
jgi:NADH-quinone oxidoreductase subunit E